MACGLSPAAPLVSRNFSGLPRASTRTWILVLNPPRERPSPCAACPPFFATYLDFAQTNVDLLGGKEGLECREQVVGQPVGVVEHDGPDAAVLIERDDPRDPEGIAHQPLDCRSAGVAVPRPPATARAQIRTLCASMPRATRICCASKRFLLRLVSPSPCLSSLKVVSTPPPR